jgi:hypothetical protein
VPPPDVRYTTIENNFGIRKVSASKNPVRSVEIQHGSGTVSASVGAPHWVLTVKRNF